jgi:hypothetical protein
MVKTEKGKKLARMLKNFGKLDVNPLDTHKLTKKKRIALSRKIWGL